MLSMFTDILTAARWVFSGCTSETSVNFCQTTRRYNPDDTHVHTLSGSQMVFEVIRTVEENSNLKTKKSHMAE
jgi:hypothetical protein